ncbi:MAG: HPr family phosphocarrier protein [Blautia sp.]|nr:HPr family phosphocarrier protein [Blautia sp.]MDY4516098.1 HPr family phosphocarrier protein [Lachnospiraceae bacterium]
MKSFNYVITDEVGIHARPAGILVKEAKKYASTIMIVKNGKKADATRLMALMGLGVKCGEEVTVEVTGDDEEAVCAEMEKFFKENL